MPNSSGLALEAVIAAESARVALGGDLTSLRYAREGVAKLSLEPGRHTLLAGGREIVAATRNRVRVVPGGKGDDARAEEQGRQFLACDHARAS